MSSKRGMSPQSAIAAINRAGALLVFPIDNRPEPASIWSHFFPRTKMRWEWDDEGDNRVANLWHLRGELSTTRKVVYTKWFRGRATYFSRPIFAALLRALNPEGPPREELGDPARRLLRILEGESPLSTKELKRMGDLQGRANERAYEKALQTLWSRMLIVAFGEVDDGAFPSLAVGSTQVLFEELWSEAWAMNPAEAERRVTETLSPTNLFYRHFAKLRSQLASPRVSSRKSAATQGPAARIPRVVRFEDL